MIDEIDGFRGTIYSGLMNRSGTALDIFFSDVEQRLVVAGNSQVVRGRAARVTEGELGAFFDELGERVAAAELEQRRIDRVEATGFNVFKLIEPDENKLSDILGILLDPLGSHGQGDRFLRLFVAQLKATGAAGLGTEAAVVRREAPTYGIERFRRRIDLLIDAGVVIGIENKVDSLE